MLDAFKRSCTDHALIALFAGIATIAKARTLDRPSTTFSAALAGSIIFMIACVLTNRAEAANPKRCEWLVFAFYARSLLALAIATFAVKLIVAAFSWTLLLCVFLIWCLAALSANAKEKAFETLLFSPVESTDATSRLATVTFIQTTLFAITLYFL